MKTQILVGTRKGLFQLEQSGDAWRIVRTSFLGVQIPMLLHDPRDGTLYAAVEHGHFGTKFHASTDGGSTWEERACPAYPPKPADAEDIIDPMRQKAVPWSLEKIWSLETGGPAQPGVLWCGTIPGGLFKSTDHGRSWSIVQSLWDRPERRKWFGGGADWPGIHSICVDPRDPQHITIAISAGGVWTTYDGGENWEVLGKGLVCDYMPPDQTEEPSAQDPHRVVACPAAPDTLWMQHHCGIFLSRDAGKNWTRIENVEPSVFGFAVAVHPTDPDRAWFVPGVKDEFRYACDGAVCVTETRDGAQTFTAHRNGLPQDHAYHLVYRHCLDITPDGKTLAFGSTTGSLWATDNSGEDWARVTAELPPIYCVRFANPSAT
jgi:photosystem II stability/assembly factor-like uncharacterized protein